MADLLAPLEGRPRSVADILRRLRPAAAPAAGSPKSAPPAQPALALPPPHRAVIGPRWHRHELGRDHGYELRADGRAIVRVQPTASGWRVLNIGAGAIREGLSAAEADALAARIARLDTLA